ncbi:hypothetical protein LINPERPRIM_LOCUS40297 [Linum perenne]
MNLSGLKSMGFSHTLGSQPISATMKLTAASFGIAKPSRTVSCVTECGSTKCPGGCLLKPSRFTALRYGILCKSSSPTSVFVPTTFWISEKSFSWI